MSLQDPTPTPAPTYILTIGLTAPITSTFALPLSAYYLFLQARAIRCGMTPEAEADEPVRNKAARASPVEFAEQVPLALLLAGLAEINGGNKKVLVGALSALTLVRVVFAEFGLMRPVEEDENHPNTYTAIASSVGVFGTAGIIAGLAGYGTWLGRSVWGLGR